MAADVLSQNVVGYYNVTLSPGYNIVANQLDYDGTGTNNTIQKVFGTSLPVGANIYAFVSGAFASPAATLGKSGWSGNTNAVNNALNPGGAVFVLLASAKTNTFVGEVLQGSLGQPYIAGYNLIASKVPQAGTISTNLGFVPAVGNNVIRFNPATQLYITPAYSVGKSGWSPSQPSLNVGEGVWLLTAAGGTWSRNFTVQ